MIKYYRPQLAFNNFTKAWEQLQKEQNSDLEGKKYFVPSYDIVESEKGFSINLALPGIKKEEVKIALNDNKLSVSGERKALESDVSLKYHRIQTEYGKFNQTFQLPENVNKETINAKQEDGILSISIEKLEKKENKSVIEVK